MLLRIVHDIPSLVNKRVFLRCDFNVPIKSKVKSLPLRGITRRAIKSKVLDDSKIQAALPTIKYLSDREAVVIVVSHFGRPKGKVDKNLSLEPVARHLGKLLRRQVIFLPYGEIAGYETRIAGTRQAKIFMLENLRFWKGEESNSKLLAKQLAGLADFYVNEAFSVCHREQASIAAIHQYLPGYAGLLLEQEIKELTKFRKTPARPALAIMGGVKISTKLPVIKSLLRKSDLIAVGGALANNFLKACGFEVGKSVIEKQYIAEARGLLSNKKLGAKIIIPVDVKVGSSLDSARQAIWRSVAEVKPDEYILDIGPRTRRLYIQFIRHSGSVIWNGPLGLFENKHFSGGTRAIVRALKKNRGAQIVVGGGDTLSAVGRRALSPKRNVFLSTGGGAMLAFLAGEEMPGLEPLIRK